MYLYKELKEIVPKFSDIAPYDSLSFGRDQERIKIYVPVSSALVAAHYGWNVDPKDIFTLKETIGYMRPADFVELTYLGKIIHTKREKVKKSLEIKFWHIFKLLGWLSGFPQDGDFELTLRDSHLKEIYGLIINHRTETARVVFKRTYSVKLTDIITNCNKASEEFAKYIRKPEVKHAMRSIKFKSQWHLLEVNEYKKRVYNPVFTPVS